MAGQLRFRPVEGRLAEISARGERLGTLAAAVDVAMFRPVLEGARAGRRAGGVAGRRSVRR